MAKILVVDDSFDDLETIKQVLETKKHEVTVATNGAQALNAAKITNFDLILLDIQMPTLSGYDLIGLLKEKMNGRTKVVFVSIIPRREADLTEVDGFIQKPFSPKAVLEEVGRMLAA
ncbi:Chemotaxis protein CheY [Candidatus Gugararchaeum adminiculabundum]|nr:Chemotaxis protein CheY [Candidatus Gugararchaeum adminiculabundum]